MTAETASNPFATGIGDVSLRAPARKPAKPKSRAKAKPRAGRIASRRASSEKIIRTSEILRGLLDNDEKSFTVKRILSSLGTTSFGTSLMVFAIPEVLPLSLIHI